MKYEPNKYEPGGNFEPRKPGEYEFTISLAEKRRSESGNDMLYLELSDTDEYYKYPIKHFISEASDWFNKNLGDLIASCGLDPKKDIGDNSLEAIAEEVQGKWVKAKTKLREHEGKKYETINYFISAFEDDAEDDIIQHREKREVKSEKVEVKTGTKTENEEIPF